MAHPSAHPKPRAKGARLMKVVNVPMRLLLSLPFATPLSRQLMLLSFTGRKTGKHYRQPVSYVPDGDTLLTPAGGRWRLNLRDGQAIMVRLRGRDVRLTPEFISDLDEVERLLNYMMKISPRNTARVPVMGPDGQVDRAKLAAVLDWGFRIIRWHFLVVCQAHIGKLL
jgi:hypothetical protein